MSAPQPVSLPDAPFGAYRIYESWAWAHAHWGRWGEAGLGGKHPDGAGPGLNRIYSWVIPNYFDPDDFPQPDQRDGSYLLFVGRLIANKGAHVAARIAA
jgi:glycosyltransferase involved in cell wall biosynthesis